MWPVDRTGRVRIAALGFAVLWSALLPLGGLTLPVYGTASGSTTDGSGDGSATLVAVNGSGVLVVLLVPLLVSVLVAAFQAVGTPPARFAAWLLTAALFGLTALAMLSIGIFVLPVPIALALACAAEHRETADAGG